MKKIAVILLVSFLMTLMALPCGLLADDGVSLTVDYAYSDVRFDIYRVAEKVGGKYQFTKDFEDCGEKLDTRYNSEREALISALSAYVKANRISPTASGYTDGNGKLVFDSLQTGVWLILGERSEDSTQYHFPAASLATLEGDLKVEIKHDDVDKPVFPPITTFVTVAKSWNVPEGTTIPDSVTVVLLRDGEEYDTATLDEDGNWSHIWSGLAPGHDWTVKETDIPEGYTSSTERTGTAFRITNTLTAVTDTDTDTDTTAPDTDTETSTDTTSDTTDSTDASDTTYDTTSPDETRHDETTGTPDDTKQNETTAPSDDTTSRDTDETSPDMKPDDPKPPKTGDDIAFWVLIFVLSAALTSVMTIVALKRVRNHR